jgi:hypothetical protein
MAKTLQLRRGTTAEITANTPASGELFVDTQKKTVTVGDGSTAGGIILARDDRVSDVFTTANGANGLAAGAFNQANTAVSGLSSKQDTLVSGTNIKTINGTSLLGSGNIPVSTGDWTFTANVANVPFNDTAVITTSGNVTTSSTTTSAYASTAWNNGGPSVLVLSDAGGAPSAYKLSYNISSGSSSWVNTMANVVVGSTIVFNDANLDTVTGTVTSYINNGTTAELYFTKTSASDPIENLGISSIATMTTSSISVANVSGTYIFETDGTFITDSVLIGDVLISDDIITPLALDSYGQVDETATGTLTINGDLEVLGSLSVSTPSGYTNITSTLVPTVTDAQFTYAGETIHRLESNKSYYNLDLAHEFDTDSNIFLPRYPNVGDFVEVTNFRSSGDPCRIRGSTNGSTFLIRRAGGEGGAWPLAVMADGVYNSVRFVFVPDDTYGYVWRVNKFIVG